jgi:hypothetical protein
MADNGSGGIGVLGVLVGALIVVIVGAGLLFATGNIGGGGKDSATLKIDVPKTTGSTNK